MFHNSKPFVPHAYESFSESYRKRKSPIEYQAWVDWYHRVTDVEFLSFFYDSNGLRVAGILARPTNSQSTNYQSTNYQSKKLPLIVYNRGGYAEGSKITVSTLQEKWYPLVQAGYVVVGTQYRGVDGGQGQDEFGGDDIYDVIALYDEAKKLEYVDAKNMFMLGYSRGGMMTYLALKQGVQVNAAAVNAGVTDFFTLDAQVDEWGKNFLAMVVPCTAEQKPTEYEKRSVVMWSDVIKVPVLLLHGDADTVVPLQQSQLLAHKLEHAHKQHKLVVYPGGEHGLDAYQNAVNHEVLAWFKKFTV